MQVEISRYKCLSCNQKITLYGGKTNAISVICEKCGKWMAIDICSELPKIIHKNGDAGTNAFNRKRREFNTAWRPQINGE